MIAQIFVAFSENLNFKRYREVNDEHRYFIKKKIKVFILQLLKEKSKIK